MSFHRPGAATHHPAQVDVASDHRVTTGLPPEVVAAIFSSPALAVYAADSADTLDKRIEQMAVVAKRLLGE